MSYDTPIGVLAMHSLFYTVYVRKCHEVMHICTHIATYVASYTYTI